MSVKSKAKKTRRPKAKADAPSSATKSKSSRKPKAKDASDGLEHADRYLLLQTINSVWLFSGTEADERMRIFKGALALREGIKPRDVLERTLAAQMIGTHNAAMECLRRANIPEQTFEGRESALKHAEKLMALFARQMEALDKHRGKGQQKVTVEHIYVNSGGQAIVGNFQTGKSKSKRSAAGSDTPQALAYAPGQTLDVPATEVKAATAMPLKRAKL